MSSLIERVDKALVDLAWSLWSGLGVAGVDQQHKNCLIALEELIILTAVVAESDPRLRDEALDWCSKYHHFVSVSRLRTLVNGLGEQVYGSFSLFAATLNSIAQTKWPIFTEVSPLRVALSGKSTLLSCEAPALLTLRLRAMFGVGIRADLLAFCLTRGANNFTAIDTVKIGYNKRSLAEVLESFVQSGLLTSSMMGNRRVYTLSKQDELYVLMGSLPKIAPDWHSILEVIIALRTILRESQSFSVSSKVIISRNVLKQLENYLKILGLSPPPISDDLDEYWNSFCQWFLNTLREVGQSNFWGSFHVDSVKNAERQVCTLMQHLYAVQDCIDGLEFTMNFALEDPHGHEKVFKENYGYAINFLTDLVKSIEGLFKFPVYSLSDIKLLEILHRFEWKDFPIVQEDVKKILAIKTVPDSSYALRQYQDLEQILNKFRSFMFGFTEQLKKFYFYNTDVHLLTLSPRLYKRREIMNLFSTKEE
jgi:hypothetical protein